jgi:retinol dehydrogenase 12
MSLTMAPCYTDAVATARGGRSPGADPRPIAAAPAEARRDTRIGGGHDRPEVLVEGSLRGKVCVVTGATSGIGRATAAALSAMGAEIGIVCRDLERGEALRAEIVSKPGAAPVRLFEADLGIQSQVRRAAGEILAAYPKLHVLVNNAGVVQLDYSETSDGVETVFAVNHLAYFLLTALLLDRLKESAPARIVNVASDAHKFVKGISFDDLGHRSSYRWMSVYGQSKLANILFTRELAHRLEGTGVTVNAVHPGAVATGLGKNNGTLSRFLIGLLKPFFRTPENGAATSIHLASSPAVEGVTGRYFAKCREAKTTRAARDDAAARRLWEVSERLTGLGGTAAAASPGAA